MKAPQAVRFFVNLVSKFKRQPKPNNWKKTLWFEGNGNIYQFSNRATKPREFTVDVVFKNLSHVKFGLERSPGALEHSHRLCGTPGQVYGCKDALERL